MRREEFTLALNALLPGCDPEAPEKWAEFAAECVDRQQFAWFIPMDDRDAAVEKWLDATFAGLYAVNREHGPEIATKVADLSNQRCALYPGEMPVVAEVLKNGGDAERISNMVASDLLEADETFPVNLPDGAGLTLQGPEISIAQSGVPCGLMERRMEPGYLLADGTALLESERDDFGRYRGGAGMDGKARLVRLESELKNAQEEAERPFPKEDELRQKSERLAQLNRELEKPKTTAADKSEDDDDEPEHEDGDAPAREPAVLSVAEGGKPSIRAAIRAYTPPAPVPPGTDKKTDE